MPFDVNASPPDSDAPRSWLSRNSRGPWPDVGVATVICMKVSLLAVYAIRRSRWFSTVQPRGNASVMPMSA